MSTEKLYVKLQKAIKDHNKNSDDIYLNWSAKRELKGLINKQITELQNYSRNPVSPQEYKLGCEKLEQLNTQMIALSTKSEELELEKIKIKDSLNRIQKQYKEALGNWIPIPKTIEVEL